MEGDDVVKRKRRNWCKQRFVVELNELEDYLLKQCEDFYRCYSCTLVMHENAMWSDLSIPGCVNCIEDRQARAKWTLLAFLGCLKRSQCHKDVYEHLFIPLAKEMRKAAWKREEWDLQ